MVVSHAGAYTTFNANFRYCFLISVSVASTLTCRTWYQAFLPPPASFSIVAIVAASIVNTAYGSFTGHGTHMLPMVEGAQCAADARCSLNVAQVDTRVLQC